MHRTLNTLEYGVRLNIAGLKISPDG